MSQQEELDLIQRAARGDAVAQQRFVMKHRVLLMRYLQKRIPPELRRHIEPQDVFQDVCFEIFRRMSTFTAGDSKMAVRWVLRIARNRIIDVVRTHSSGKRGGGRMTNFEDDPSGEDSVVKWLQELAVHERTPSRSAISHELISALERSLKKMPDDYRQAIRYRYIEGMTVEQTAEKLKRTKGAALMLCNRGLKSLRMELRSFSRYL